jgi:6,7-dimethyl-8-ribityllumazine synthase
MYHVLVVEAKFYEHISAKLAEGAIQALEAQGATFERITVPGALEIPGAIRFAINKERYDGFIALGCVIRGETSHYDIVANESARGLQELTRSFNVAIGNGILTVENEAQALERADMKKKDKGGFAANAVLQMIALKNQFTIKQKTY